MNITFERGSADSPRGHALIYFHDSQVPGELLATYLVVLPILVDVSKYVPPFLMNQMGDVGAKELSAFAFPPAPEPVESLDALRSLAEARGDDILFGGTITSADIASLLGSVNEAIGWYAELCTDQVLREEEDAPELPEPGELSVNDVLYGLMSDRDKLNELTRLVGRLRDAVHSGDAALSGETRHEIMTLGRHLPDAHQVCRLADAASSGADNAAQLTNLYLQRCFYLIAEEYVKLGQVEDEIRSLEES